MYVKLHSDHLFYTFDRKILFAGVNSILHRLYTRNTIAFVLYNFVSYIKTLYLTGTSPVYTVFPARSFRIFTVLLNVFFQTRNTLVGILIELYENVYESALYY